jgi:hypothetical protein
MNQVKVSKRKGGGHEVLVSVIPAEDVVVMLQSKGGYLKPGLIMPMNCPHPRGHKSNDKAMACLLDCLKEGP